MIEKIKNIDSFFWFMTGIIVVGIILVGITIISANNNNNKNEIACLALQEQRYETVWIDYICFIKTDVGWFAMNSPEKEANYDTLIPLLLINSFD